MTVSAFLPDKIDFEATIDEQPQKPAQKLTYTFASELDNNYQAPDEIVEGVLTAGAGSILYGDSNSGKTFLALDMSVHVALGYTWMSRRIEKGMVIYLAAESPTSVISRVQAWQMHHGLKVKNLCIVENPIDLFSDDADTNSIVELVKALEHERGQKALLIVGDTLARISAGANENAGSDMGLVIKRFDHIRKYCQAHFMLIHHCGKNAAAGARGWSGVRAAVDTEIEVTDISGEKCAEITKQRDLDSKGVRQGFRLESVSLGTSKWGKPVTSCIVKSADAPEKTRTVSEVEGAILGFLLAKDTGDSRKNIVSALSVDYRRTSVYRSLKKLLDERQVIESNGYISLSLVSGSVKETNREKY